MIVEVPDSIPIGSHAYEVLFDSTQGDRNYRGTFTDQEHEIRLGTQLHPQQLRVTFVHEVLHAIFNLEDLQPPESDVYRLAEDLSQVLFVGLGLDLDFSKVKTIRRVADDSK